MRVLHLEVEVTALPSWSTVVYGRCKHLFPSVTDPAAPGPSVVAAMPPSLMVQSDGLVVVIGPSRAT